MLALLVVLLALGSATSASAQSLIRNGGFVEGSGEKPDGWQTEQWSNTLGTTFEWKQSDGGLGVAVVRNPQPNDARWSQNVRVQPETWYHLSGNLRAIGEDLGAGLQQF